jgi:hypothetical protein
VKSSIENWLASRSYSVEDPETWVEPWGGDYEFAAVKGSVYEFGCHEGNYGLANILSGGRLADQLAAAKGN